MRESIKDDDVLGLRADEVDELTADVPEPNDWGALNEAEKIERFEDWLQEAQESEVLEVVSRDENRYVRRAYERGFKDADRRLRGVGVAVGNAPSMEVALSAGIHERKLQALFTENFERLEGITADVTEDVKRTLADGLAEGESPTTMARRLTNRVDATGKNWATVRARTEVVRAHSEATLTRFEQMGLDTVTIRAEWSTAGDRRVCPICASLDGQVFSIEKVRTETFQFSPGEGVPNHLAGEYPIQPPAHPQCRCALLPIPDHIADDPVDPRGEGEDVRNRLLN
jgi:SPP1 gp7 family putative phage head morphogenesis protein